MEVQECLLMKFWLEAINKGVFVGRFLPEKIYRAGAYLQGNSNEERISVVEGYN